MKKMKMKKTILALTVASVALSSGAAVAADSCAARRLIIRRGAQPLQLARRSMLGVNVGYQWGKVTNSALEPSGFLGGLQGRLQLADRRSSWSAAKPTFR